MEYFSTKYPDKNWQAVDLDPIKKNLPQELDLDSIAVATAGSFTPVPESPALSRRGTFNVPGMNGFLGLSVRGFGL